MFEKNNNSDAKLAEQYSRGNAPERKKSGKYGGLRMLILAGLMAFTAKSAEATNPIPPYNEEKLKMMVMDYFADNEKIVDMEAFYGSMTDENKEQLWSFLSEYYERGAPQLPVKKQKVIAQAPLKLVRGGWMYLKLGAIS